MISLFLSNNMLLAVVGDGGSRAAIKKCVRTGEVSGCFFNGRVTDSARFIRIVSELFSKNDLPSKDVTLVLSSTHIITRQLKAPLQKDEQMLRFVENEMAEIERAHDPAFGYEILKSDKKTRFCEVMAVMADRKFIENYVSLFARCGVEITSVRASLACMLNVLKLNNLDNKSCIIELAENDGFLSILMENGEYRYSTYNRLSENYDTEEITGRIASSVSNITQFAKAQQISEVVTEVYVYGVSGRRLATVKESIESTAPGITVNELDCGERVEVKCLAAETSAMYMAAGGMLGDRKRGNLLYRIKSDTKQRKAVNSFLRASVLPAILLLVMLSISIVLLAVKSSRQAKLDVINNYMASDEILSQSDYYDALNAENSKISARTKSAESLRKVISAYPIPDSSVRQLLEECAANLATVEIVQYNGETGELNISAQSDAVDNISRFIDKLSENGAFQVNPYTGYSYDENSGVWRIDLSIYLSANTESGEEG